jgi:hypothetical protein
MIGFLSGDYGYNRLGSIGDRQRCCISYILLRMLMVNHVKMRAALINTIVRKAIYVDKSNP